MKCKVGDKVIIRNPEFFVRCGYPKTMDDQILETERNHGDKILQFINSVFRSYDIEKIKLVGFNKQDRLYTKVLREVAFEELKSCGFGGDRRSVHIKTVAELKDAVCSVVDWKFVKTGVYERGFGPYQSYNGEYDYEPPYLGDIKTHKILRLKLDSPFSYSVNGNFDYWRIEDIHVDLM